MTKRDVELSEPIKRGDDVISGFDLRRPKAGELRGVTITDIIRMDVAAIATVLPRITIPPISANEVADLDPYDLGEAAAQVSNFFTEPPETKPKNDQPSRKTSSTEPQTSPSSSDGDQETSGNSNSTSSSNGGDAPAKS